MLYLVFVIGVLLGAAIAILLNLRYTSYGTLEIDQSGTEKDVYRLNLNKFDMIEKKKRIVLKVDANADLSRERQSLL